MKVLPYSAALNQAYQFAGNAKSFGNLSVQSGFATDRKHLIGLQFGLPMSLADWHSSLSTVVLDVFTARAVLKVLYGVKCFVVDLVAHLLACGDRANESLGDKPVNVEVRLPAVSRQLDGQVAGSALIRGDDLTANKARPCGAISGVSIYGANSTSATDFISRRGSYRFPNFWRIRQISHGAVLSRCGQGRALLTQRFRPVLHSRIRLVSQGGMP